MRFDNCQLEIDELRGVGYVHSPEGVTLLRINGLPTPVPKPDGLGRGMLDILLKFQKLTPAAFSWRGSR